MGGPVLPLVMVGYLGMVTGLDATAFRILIPEIQQNLGIGVGTITVVATALPLVTVAFGPLIGFVADRTKRVTLQAVGSLVAHSSIVLGGLAPTAGLFVGSKVLGSGGSALSAPAGLSLLSDYYPPTTRGRIFSFVGFASASGAIVAPLLAGAMATGLGWRRTLIVLGSVATLASLSLFLLKEPVRGMQDRLALGADPERATREQRPLGWRESWRAAWGIRTVRRIAYAQPFLTAGLNTSGVLTILYYAQRFHLSPLGRGVVVTLAYCPALLGSLLVGVLADRIIAWRPGRIMTLAAAVVAVVGVGLLMIVNTPILAVAVAFHGFISFIAAFVPPSISTTISLVMPARFRAFGQQAIAPLVAVGLIFSLALSAFAQSAGIGAGIAACVPIILVGAAILATAAPSLGTDIRAGLAASLSAHTESDVEAEPAF